MQVAAANNDFITPPVISAAEADYERNLANTIDLVYLLVNDEQHGAANRAAVPGLARQARRAGATRPPPGCSRSGRSRIPSRSRSRTCARRSEERLGKILGELGLDALNGRTRTCRVAARGATHQNIFKAMKDITFEQTISHQCGVTMNDSVEARAIAEFMAEKPGVTVTYQPALIRIDGDGKLVFKMDEISEYLGREMTAEIFEVNTSTHYGRMVRVDDNTVDPVRQHGRGDASTSDQPVSAEPGAPPWRPRPTTQSRGENNMFMTPEGKEIFVIDGHTHFWDGSPENQRNIHGKQFIDCFYGYHTALSPPEQRWEKAKFEKYSADDLYHDLFIDGPDDMAIVQSTYLKDFYKNGFNTIERNAAVAKRYPGPLHRQRRLRPARRRARRSNTSTS